MPLADTLIGCGIPDLAARRLGQQQVAVTAAGTAQTTGTVILPTQTAITLTTAGGATAVVLPADAEYYRLYYIFNASTTTGLIFPSSGYGINATTVDNSINLATLQTRVCFRVGALQWASMITS